MLAIPECFWKWQYVQSIRDKIRWISFSRYSILLLPCFSLALSLCCNKREEVNKTVHLISTFYLFPSNPPYLSPPAPVLLSSGFCIHTTYPVHSNFFKETPPQKKKLKKGKERQKILLGFACWKRLDAVQLQFVNFDKKKPIHATGYVDPNLLRIHMFRGSVTTFTEWG